MDEAHQNKKTENSSQARKQFKNWTIPGPELRTPLTEIPVEAHESLDALSGNYRIFQLREGHRFSTDDLLVAWFGTAHAIRADRVLDLGSGIGSVAMTAAWRLPGAQFVTIEAQKTSYELALKSIRLNDLSDRFDARFGDLRDREVLSPEEKFDLILGSPPYFPLEAGVHGDHDQKIACRFEVRGTVRDYCETAFRHLAPGAMLALVFPVRPADQEERMRLAARDSGLVILRERFVRFREDESPLLGLFLLMNPDDLPAAFVESISKAPVHEPDLVIRTRDGKIHPEYSAVKLSIGFPP